MQQSRPHSGARSFRVGLTLRSSRKHTWNQAEPAAIACLSLSWNVVFSGLLGPDAPNVLLCDFGLISVSACLCICK